MFVILLRFAANRAAAPQHMQGHKEWIDRGITDGVFLVVGSLQPGPGGAIIAHGASRDDVEARVAEDPFVVENVVTAEVLEIAPNRTDERLRFLMAA